MDVRSLNHGYRDQMRHFAKRVTRKIASKLAKLLLSLVQKDSAQEPYTDFTLFG
jgi:hypothetical protein